MHVAPPTGDKKPRPGIRSPDRVDNWRQPVGQTESVANRLPAGRAKRVNPLTAIFKEELVRKYGLFLHVAPPEDENPRPGFDSWRSPASIRDRAASRPLPAADPR
ncbi:hypothetical protein DMH27_00925 [Raoultella planticola]|nr:hypothetical protein [Raoultella planticola]